MKCNNISFLGERVTLQGWTGYRGGLDVKSNSTGTHSSATKHEGISIMFHVAPMLFDECRQRIIGNDITVFVWLEEGKWYPSALSSQVLHNQIIIRPIPSVGGPIKVKVEICGREGTESSNPPNVERVWELNDELREFLLRKAINCERAAWNCNTKAEINKNLYKSIFG